MTTFFSREEALDHDSDNDTVEQIDDNHGIDSNVIFGYALMAVGAAVLVYLVYFFPNTLYSLNTPDDTFPYPRPFLH